MNINTKKLASQMIINNNYKKMIGNFQRVFFSNV